MDSILKQFADAFRSGAHGAHLDADNAKAVAEALDAASKTQLTPVKFEQLLSHKPKGEQFCIRDAIFDLYCGITKDTEKANVKTKQFTDELYRVFVGDLTQS